MALLRQTRSAGPESWDVPHPDSTKKRYGYDRSLHYRFVLLVCLASSGVATWHASATALGHQPGFAQWLAWLALTQIVGGWLILVSLGALTESLTLTYFGLLSIPQLVIHIKKGTFPDAFVLGCLGLLPSVCFHAYGAAHQLWGTATAVMVSGLTVASCCAAVARGLLLERRWNARTHPICDLVLKPLL
jgi:hypothetical protein